MTELEKRLEATPLPLIRELSMVCPDPRYRQGLHRHDWHELVMVLEGDYAVRVAGRRWRGAPGDLFCYPAGCEHLPTYGRDLATRLFVFAWEGGPGIGGPWQRRDGDGRILGQLHWMREQHTATTPEARDLQTVLATAVLLHLAADATGPAPAERVRAFLAQNLEHPIDLRQAADVIGVGPRRLDQLYRERYDCSPMRDLARLRAQAAAQLLRDNRYDLATIAARVGLGSASALSRLLERELGRRPSELRRRAR